MSTHKHSHPFRKKWGQNFLADQNLLNRIVRTIQPQGEDSILEIGPGEGALTELILPYVNEMASVEIDPLLIDYLGKKSNFKDLSLVHGDILQQSNLGHSLCEVGSRPQGLSNPSNHKHSEYYTILSVFS